LNYINGTSYVSLNSHQQRENDKFIEKITNFIRKEKVDFWNELSLAEQKEIENGIKELDKGKRVEYNKFLKKIS